MGSNKKKPATGAMSGPSGNDPRGQSQNQVAHQQERYESQQGPMVSAFAENYGRGSEANYGDYTDIMNRYRDIAGGGAGGSGAGSGGGGGGYSAFTVNPGKASYNDPFKSYEGYTEFSKTGGYSPEDIANMRARGTSPVRAAYANAERNIGQQRSLQGGYAPNAIAAQVKMAREQGQGTADAMQNVEAGLAEAKNRGRLAGLGGMSNIEGQRLGADVDISKFNTGLDFQGQTFNAQQQANAQSANNSSRDAASARGSDEQMAALRGMTQLYGTTPAMSETFGNQLLQGVGQGGNFGLGLMNSQNQGQQLPGAFEQGMDRAQQVVNAGAGMAYPWLNNGQKKQQQQPAMNDPRSASQARNWEDY